MKKKTLKKVLLVPWELKKIYTITIKKKNNPRCYLEKSIQDITQKLKLYGGKQRLETKVKEDVE